MKRTIEQLLDYAEQCMDAAIERDWVEYPKFIAYMQRQCELATELAKAATMAAVIKLKPAPIDLSE